MNDDEVDLDDADIIDDDDPSETWQPESIAKTKADAAASRRRIEDLKERKRMRELLQDDEFELDFN
ncbi:MAG: hypothetical protein O3C28_01230 [Proteobacteria bacterium]|nr:hypothetical protein [Pseudomonadota bacterium]